MTYLALDLKILSTGISLNFARSFSYDEFTHAVKNKGFEQRFYTIGRMTGTDSQGNPLKQNLEKSHSEQSSDMYNLIGKYCMAHPYNKTLIVGQNFTQSGGINIDQIPSLVDEMKLVINMLWSTTKMLHEDVAEGALLAVITVSDNELFSSNANDFEHSFENMAIKEFDDEIILNPDFYRGMDPKDISEYVKSHPEVTKKTHGWGEIKVKCSDQQYTISLEYKTDDVDKMMEMIEHSDSYCASIIQKVKNKY